jgi:hypothetical protein
MPDTPNYSWTYPSPGDQDWGQTLNLLFEDIDGTLNTQLATKPDSQLDPSTISASDLGFDPATQAELDTHASTTDAHHVQASGGQPKFAESGSVAAGTAGQIVALPVPDGQTLAVSEATLGVKNSNDLPGSPPTGLDLSIFINDGGTAVQGEKILQGDGTTTSASGSGSPLASYANTTGGTQMVAIIVDNGGVDSNSGTGSQQDTTTNGSYTVE